MNTNVYNASEIDEAKGPLQCFMCKKNHSLYQCIEFLNLPIVERITRVKSLKLCANCLKRNHNTTKCKASSCRQCIGKHNSLLHTENAIAEVNPVQSVVSHVKNNKSEIHQVLLSTAQILVKNRHEQWVLCRVLLDVGSQSNFITKRFGDQLELEANTIQGQILVVEINGSSSEMQQVAKCHIKSRY